MTDCEHDWHWLRQPHYTFGPLGQLITAVNVECRRCGAYAWAHGRMPIDSRPPLETTPTTGRS